MSIAPRLTTLLFTALVATASIAQEHGTRDEAKALVGAAIAHVAKVGKDQAFKDFTADRASWTKKDLYVFAQDFQGTILAHGANDKLVGKNLIDMKDQNGKPFARELIDVGSKKGEGWVDYDWAHPVTRKSEAKSSYVKRIPGFDGIVVVGFYR